MFKRFIVDQNPSARKTDYAVSFTLFGSYGRPAARCCVTVRTNSAARAMRLVRQEYRRSGDHKVLHVTPLLACARQPG